MISRTNLILILLVFMTTGCYNYTKGVSNICPKHHIEMAKVVKPIRYKFVGSHDSTSYGKIWLPADLYNDQYWPSRHAIDFLCKECRKDHTPKKQKFKREKINREKRKRDSITPITVRITGVLINFRDNQPIAGYSPGIWDIKKKDFIDLKPDRSGYFSVKITLNKQDSILDLLGGQFADIDFTSWESLVNKDHDTLELDTIFMVAYDDSLDLKSPWAKAEYKERAAFKYEKFSVTEVENLFPKDSLIANMQLKKLSHPHSYLMVTYGIGGRTCIYRSYWDIVFTRRLARKPIKKY